MSAEAMPGLVVIGGLPGTGKTTIGLSAARHLTAAYLRVDTIEQALVSSGELDAAPVAVGYHLGYALAADQLRVGRSVIAECVNPLAITRDAWRAVAVAHHCWTVDVELICSDRDEHRRRVETRTSDIPGLVLPTWQQVIDREYEPWHRDRLVIDTAQLSTAEAVGQITQHVTAAVRSIDPPPERRTWRS